MIYFYFLFLKFIYYITPNIMINSLREWQFFQIVSFLDTTPCKQQKDKSCYTEQQMIGMLEVLLENLFVILGILFSKLSASNGH